MLARSLLVVANGVAFAAATTIVLPYHISAQVPRGVEIAPALGIYRPHGRLPVAGVTTANCFSDGLGGCRDNCVKQRGAVAIGGSVTAWFSHRAAIEGSVWYSPSAVTGFFGGDYASTGSVVLTDIRLVVRQGLAPQVPVASIVFTAGPALIHRSGRYYTYLAGATSLGGILGIGLDIRPGRHLGLRAQIEDFLYRLDLTPVGFSGNTSVTLSGSKRAFQQDFVLSFSVSLLGQRSPRRDSAS